jgi:hypothetical protein
MIDIQPVPMMDPPEIEAVRRLIEERKPKRVLEWGSGGSTLYWPAEFPDVEWVSIEHNPEYAAALEGRLHANTTLHRLDFPAYYQLPAEFGVFDLVIVDGRERVRCLDAARSLLAPGGAVVLHDAGRERYEPGRHYYERLTVLVEPKAGKDPRGLWLLEDPVAPRPCPQETASRGVIYLCWGEPATLQAEASMHSLWKVAPDMPVLVVGDGEACRYFDGQVRVQACEVDVDPFDGEHLFGFKAGRVKPLLAGLSPFERSLYVDAETEFKRSPDEGFALLDKWDFVIAEAETRSLAATHPAANQQEPGETAEWLGTGHILYHNSGMFFWRKNDATRELFDLWAEEWQRYGGWDEQIALLRALLRSDVLWLNVPFTWNCREAQEAYFVYHRFASKAARKYRNPHNMARPARATPALVRLVEVELEPGRLVRCRPEDEEKVREQFARMKGTRVKWR